MTDSRHIKVRTPGKLILSGEHAVVYGNPAIGMAINRYMDVTLRWLPLPQWSFDLMGIRFKRQVTLTALLKLKRKIERQYHKFREGEHSIREVLKHPFELSLYTATNVIDKFRAHLPNGIGFATDSNIPTGCGMGSSAATVVSLIHAMSELLKLELTIDNYIDLGVESENLQHGSSSGLDVHVVYRGGCQLYQNRNSTPIEYNSDWPWQLVNTGTPYSSTGECVTAAKQYLNTEKLTEFANITNELSNNLTNNNLSAAQESIMKNHMLLQQISVTPKTVSDFVAACNKLGAAAKICGAGACRGEHGGMVLVLGNSDIRELCEKFGYQLMPIEIEARGSHVI